MMMPPSSSSGSFLAMCAAASRLMFEGGDQVEVEDGLEGLEAVRAFLAQRPLGDTAAGRGHHHLPGAQLVDGGLRRLPGSGEVGDVDG